MLCACIDLKSFYASVECVERGLNPMTTNLVVADPERGSHTICLAVSPSMKKLGVRNRCRAHEIPKSLDYIIAPPRMQLYIDYSARIYNVYLKYISPEDIHVYSIDEVFLDLTRYTRFYGLQARALVDKIRTDIAATTGIPATCGLGTNLYLAKVALDIMAKKAPDGIGVLTEALYQAKLWQHQPLTDFWRIGPGTLRRLEHYGLTTMERIALADERLLHKLFGVDAELLMDHAWGLEPTTIADIKAYQPKSHSTSSGQVLMRDYTREEALLIVKEMTDLVCLDLVDKQLVTSSITLHIGYAYQMQLEPAHGTARLEIETSADSIILPAVTALYQRIVRPDSMVRRITITCNHVRPARFRQMTLFEDTKALEQNKKIQETVLDIKKRFGKNAILKGMNLEEAATTRERNRQIGGHKSGE